MTTLFDFYKELRGFAEGHRMVNFFKVVGSIDEISTINIDHRSLFISVDSTDLSHQNNMMAVTFSLFVIDKCLSEDQDSLIVSIQENLFVVSQVQDYILSLDSDVNFDEVVVAQAPDTDYTSTAAVCSFTVLFDKNIKCTDYSLNSTHVPQLQSNFFETESGSTGTYYEGSARVIFVMQEEDGNLSASIINATLGFDFFLELTSESDETHTIEVPVSGSTTVIINEDIDPYFASSGTLSVKIWEQDSEGNKYVKSTDPLTYESVTLNFVK